MLDVASWAGASSEMIESKSSQLLRKAVLYCITDVIVTVRSSLSYVGIRQECRSEEGEASVRNSSLSATHFSGV